eukprot:NODE_4043_length_823_cov_43.084770_g4020_i0.p1 GENE.NODE_4043_length_823_cov_43.084770_g4020_i0~~NODE_4043_length_823_cov_43.084770_g4020_i0.p1  ORF type:complete len:233 (+),score=25.58 NODE_4043_length_823_cov_43.084770_g4020_i0:105-701(+)
MALVEHPTDPTYVFSGSLDRSIRQWNLETQSCVNTVVEGRGGIMALAWTPGPTPDLLVCAGTSVVRFNLDGDAVEDFHAIGHTDAIYCMTACDKWLFTGSKDNTMRQWDMQSGDCVAVFRDHVRPVTCLLPHRTEAEVLLYSAGLDNCVKRWRLGSAPASSKDSARSVGKWRLFSARRGSRSSRSSGSDSSPQASASA